MPLLCFFQDRRSTSIEEKGVDQIISRKKYVGAAKMPKDLKQWEREETGECACICKNKLFKTQTCTYPGYMGN